MRTWTMSFRPSPILPVDIGGDEVGAMRTGPPPVVVLIGGPDVDARLDLMRHLRGAFTVSALGSRPALRAKFAAEGFAYGSYQLRRGVNPLADLLTLGQLAGTLWRLKPQIVHAFDTKPGIWGCLAARLAGVPVIIATVTGLGSLYVRKTWRIWGLRMAHHALQKLACRLSDMVIFQNHEDAEHFVAAGLVPDEKVTVVPGSGVATDTFDPARVSAQARGRVRAELGIGHDEVVVAMISRVIRSKGVPEFLAAARTVCRGHPRVRFLLVGPEDEGNPDRLGRDELADLRRTVAWAGARHDIPAVLAISDVFVLPSAYREGVPRVLLEAAAMGLPLVTTDSPGCHSVVEHGVNGFLVPVQDVGALSRAIARLISAPELRGQFGRASRHRAVTRFDVSVVAAQTGAVYRRLLQQKQLWPAPAGSTLHAPGPGRRVFRSTKRLMDVTIAVGVLAVTWPLILVGAVAVKLTSPGPAFYLAKRAGLGGRPFRMYKLRTMYVDTDTPDRRITSARDDRRTPLGGLLRALRIDELPQFWNVLRGEMSVVGPRPEDWDIVQEHYSPARRRVLEVRPGIVSPADVRWYPDLTYHDPPPEGVPAQEHYLRWHLPIQVAEGLRYVERQSLLLDLAVIVQTVFCVAVRSWLPPTRRPVSLASDANAGERAGADARRRAER